MRRAALWVWAQLPPWLTARLAWALAAKINVGVCAIMFHGTDGVLLAAHPYKPMAPWQLPGGYLRAGEQPAAGLGRELHEELGLTLERYHLVYAEALPRHMTLFYVVKAGGTFRSSAEVSDLRAFPCDALPPTLPPEQCRALLLATRLRDQQPMLDHHIA